MTVTVTSNSEQSQGCLTNLHQHRDGNLESRDYLTVASPAHGDFYFLFNRTSYFVDYYSHDRCVGNVCARIQSPLDSCVSCSCRRSSLGLANSGLASKVSESLDFCEIDGWQNGKDISNRGYSITL